MRMIFRQILRNFARETNKTWLYEAIRHDINSRRQSLHSDGDALSSGQHLRTSIDTGET